MTEPLLSINPLVDKLMSSLWQCPHTVHAWLGTAGELEDNHLTGNCFSSTAGSIYKMNWDTKAFVFLWLKDQQYFQMPYIFLVLLLYM